MALQLARLVDPLESARRRCPTTASLLLLARQSSVRPRTADHDHEHAVDPLDPLFGRRSSNSASPHRAPCARPLGCCLGCLGSNIRTSTSHPLVLLARLVPPRRRRQLARRGIRLDHAVRAAQCLHRRMGLRRPGRLLAVLSVDYPGSHTETSRQLEMGRRVKKGASLRKPVRVRKALLLTPRTYSPSQWYPAPTFPDPAREENKKPLYCAPPRSAPLEGVAFVAVLSSDEVRPGGLFFRLSLLAQLTNNHDPSLPPDLVHALSPKGSDCGRRSATLVVKPERHLSSAAFGPLATSSWVYDLDRRRT